MSALVCSLSLDREGYAPGESAVARASWTLERAPRGAILEILYEVSGEHDQERVVVLSVDLARQPRPAASSPYRDADSGASNRPPLAAEDERQVEIELPRAPNSFEGKRLRIRWTAELRMEPGGERSTVPIAISPTRAPIRALAPEVSGSDDSS